MSIWDKVSEGGRWAWWAFVLAPSGMLYRHGPGGLGFHEGASPPDICSSITNVGASFWQSSEDARQQCLQRIDARVESVAVFLTAAVYFAVAARCAWTAGREIPLVLARFFCVVCTKIGSLCTSRNRKTQREDTPQH